MLSAPHDSVTHLASSAAEVYHRFHVLLAGLSTLVGTICGIRDIVGDCGECKLGRPEEKSVTI